MKITPVFIQKYQTCKELLKIPVRYTEVFEFRYGLADRENHTLKETGMKFKISGSRAGQLIARVSYEVENIVNK